MRQLRVKDVRRLGDAPQWLVFLASGVVLLAVSLPNLVVGLRFVTTAQHATGTIVEIVEVDKFDHGPVYAPVVRFTTSHETQVQFQSTETADDRSYYRIGQPVRVLYAADDPYQARIDTWQSRWGQDAIVPTLSILIIAVALIGWARARRALGL
ncbi:MAG TPA: DUF3592 domain-containing protein [Candidatus Limnocylindrales bacterium]|nr:DUF3592 domain-containing protein [Candidatus Limnocylindrales bacterium]